MRLVLLGLLILISVSTFSQTKLKPGFDAREYIALFSLARGRIAFSDSVHKKEGLTYKLAYRSPEVGLKNRWSFFRRSDGVGIIDIRGTVADQTSWLANFYAAMIPANGTLHLTDSTLFHYKFASDDKAAVHTGWAVSLGFMAAGMLQKIKEHYTLGMREFFIFGHSQGGAIAFLTTSYLLHLQQDGQLPKDIRFKTYCSAGPKPGNMNYAYDYEFMTRGGWAFNVVNAADWVPESPYTVQTLQDMHEINPLLHTKGMLQKQNLLVRMVGNRAFRRFSNRPRKLQQKYTNLFGNTLYNFAIKKAIQQYQKPDYFASSNYMRAGVPIVLIPDEEYHQQFKFDENKKDYFVHHHFAAYLYLIKKYYLNQ